MKIINLNMLIKIIYTLGDPREEEEIQRFSTISTAEALISLSFAILYGI